MCKVYMAGRPPRQNAKNDARQQLCSKSIYFYFTRKRLWDPSIPKRVYLILKTKSLVQGSEVFSEVKLIYFGYYDLINVVFGNKKTIHHIFSG